MELKQDRSGRNQVPRFRSFQEGAAPAWQRDAFAVVPSRSDGDGRRCGPCALFEIVRQSFDEAGDHTGLSHTTASITL